MWRSQRVEAKKLATAGDTNQTPVRNVPVLIDEREVGVVESKEVYSGGELYRTRLNGYPGTFVFHGHGSIPSALEYYPETGSGIRFDGTAGDLHHTHLAVLHVAQGPGEKCRVPSGAVPVSGPPPRGATDVINAAEGLSNAPKEQSPQNSGSLFNRCEPKEEKGADSHS